MEIATGGLPASMTFSPINDDHAVQSVSFSVLLDRPLDQRTITYAQGQHKRWQSELPAVQTPQMFGIEVGPGGGLPRQVNGQGVEFSYMRPDGTPAWQLRFEGPAIIVECTRYTRWERIWRQARSHMRNALAVVDEATFDTDATVVAASLQYVDKFAAESTEYDLNSLFAENDYLPKAVPSFGNVWHAHAGWFDYSNDLGPILNNLNLDAKHEPSLAGSASSVVSILHLQQVRYTQRLDVKAFRAAAETAFEGLMDTLHVSNKKLVSGLLGEEMKIRIGLADAVRQEV